MSKRYAVITTVSMFKVRYVVDEDKVHAFDNKAPIDDQKLLDWSEKSVMEDELDDFSQIFLGETVLERNIMEEEEVIELFYRDNKHAADWDTEQVKKYMSNLLRDNKT